MDRGSWQATVHGVSKESDTAWQLKNKNNPWPVALASLALAMHILGLHPRPMLRVAQQTMLISPPG